MTLPQDQRRDLLSAATEALSNAHAPYSGYRVGAAVLCESGTIIAGANVENASYGLTLCAERVAVASAVAAGQRDLCAIAIAAGPGAPLPCGACLQVLAEFLPPDAPVLVLSVDDGGPPECYTLIDLLPHPFVYEPDPLPGKDPTP
jgi:cytidine deaminase